MMREREREREEDAFLQEGGCVFTSASLWPMNSWTERERGRGMRVYELLIVILIDDALSCLSLSLSLSLEINSSLS